MRKIIINVIMGGTMGSILSAYGVPIVPFCIVFICIAVTMINTMTDEEKITFKCANKGVNKHV